jgi:hypothetical protein
VRGSKSLWVQAGKLNWRIYLGELRRVIWGSARYVQSLLASGCYRENRGGYLYSDCATWYTLIYMPIRALLLSFSAYPCLLLSFADVSCLSSGSCVSPLWCDFAALTTINNQQKFLQPHLVSFKLLQLKCNIKVRWPPNSKISVAVLCDDYLSELVWSRAGPGSSWSMRACIC